MSTQDRLETTDVVICGCGPTGAMLSAYLGRSCVPNIVLEKEPDITTDPRGIALDEDGIRLLQGLGLYDAIYSEIGSCMGLFNFIGGVHHDLGTKPFMVLDYSTTEGGTGHVGFICHKQPSLEKHLRSAVRQTTTSEIRVGATVNAIREDENWVYVIYQDESGQQRTIRSKFLVGADGKTGFTRKQYLEPRGIRMEKASQTSYEEIWVALNWRLTLPTPRTHPNFPLWSLGYTPEQVYDLFFPEEFRFLCNPKRPAVCGRFGLLSDRLWRFEFVVQKGENGDEMARPDKIREVVYPYITHPGRRYGLKKEVQFPEDCINVLRSRPFTFVARSCNKWSQDRVILCGDSAHVFPPFGGQGIASGFRDASGLAWRLAIACRPNYKDYDSLFKGWYMERKQQLEKSLAATVKNGRNVTETNRLRIFIRDYWLWFVQLIPSWKRWLQQGPLREGITQYQYSPGMPFMPSTGGFCFPQVYCVKLAADDKESRVQFTDDIIYAPWKQGLFQVVVLLHSLEEYQSMLDALRDLDAISSGDIRANEATYILHDVNQLPINASSYGNIYRIATGNEFAQDTLLCSRRPPPKYYNEHRMLQEAGGKNIVLLRPDRFVFAACSSKEELNEAAATAAHFLKGNIHR